MTWSSKEDGLYMCYEELMEVALVSIWWPKFLEDVMLSQLPVACCSCCSTMSMSHLFSPFNEYCDLIFSANFVAYRTTLTRWIFPLLCFALCTGKYIWLACETTCTYTYSPGPEYCLCILDIATPLSCLRHIDDECLESIAKYCPELEQLDILGTNRVSSKGIMK